MVIEYFLDWVKTASVAKRINAAMAIARASTRKGLTSEEREEVEAALTILLEDKSAAVRRAIAEALGAYSSAPRHVINALANDVEDVSVIVLSQSSVLHDAELMNFVRNGSPGNQIAISCRPWLSADVTATICRFGCKAAAHGLLMNSAAQFTTNDLHQIAERHGVSSDIRNLLTARSDLAAETRHLLIAKLGEALGGFVKEKAWLPKSRLDKAIGEASDRASIMLAAKSGDEEVANVVRNLIAGDRLTVSFLVRAICMGNISLVACAFSELSGVRFGRVEAILTHNRQSAFKAVYDRAGLPKQAFVVFKTAIEAWRKVLTSDVELDQARMPFMVTREVQEAYLANAEGAVDELVVLLRKLFAETAREHSKAKAAEISTRKIEVKKSISQPEVTEIPVICTKSATEKQAGPNSGSVQEIQVEFIEKDKAVGKITDAPSTQDAAANPKALTFEPTVIAA